MSAGNLHVEARDRDIIVTMPDTSSGWCIEGLIAVPISWRGSTIFNMSRRVQLRGHNSSLAPGSSPTTRRASWGGLCKRGDGPKPFSLNSPTLDTLSNSRLASYKL
jgi:hypothetical protein